MLGLPYRAVGYPLARPRLSPAGTLMVTLLLVAAWNLTKHAHFVNVGSGNDLPISA
tara:strand:- start:539 stop:706 length:168 start_codon:yes stop_codon:yes gene_type:complete